VILGLPGGNLLIDTPPELRLQLTREGIGLAHAVLYTHAHADHLFGLDDTRIFASYLDADLPIYCEASVEARIRQAFSYVFDPVVQHTPNGGLPRVVFRPITAQPFELLGARVVPIPMWHGTRQVLGYRIGGIGYCTDTSGIPPQSMSLLEGLDVLILDCLRRSKHPTHFSLEQALAVAKQLGARRTLFTHLCHDLEHEATSAVLPPTIELAYDGLSLDLHL
jgi:phosphoribosyl 1,2-cyclic phosphate phosphodiesterase